MSANVNESVSDSLGDLSGDSGSPELKTTLSAHVPETFFETNSQDFQESFIDEEMDHSPNTSTSVVASEDFVDSLHHTDDSIIFAPASSSEPNIEESLEASCVDSQDDSILFENSACSGKERSESIESVDWSDSEASHASAASSPMSTSRQVSFTISPGHESANSPLSFLVECKGHKMKRGKKAAEVSVHLLDQSGCLSASPSDCESGSPLSFFVKPSLVSQDSGTPLTVHVSSANTSTPAAEGNFAMNFLIQDDEFDEDEDEDWDEDDDDVDIPWDPSVPICGLITDDSSNHFGFQFTFLESSNSAPEGSLPKPKSVVEANRKWKNVYNDAIPSKEHKPSQVSFTFHIPSSSTHQCLQSV
jgi:hypothetical protein